MVECSAQKGFFLYQSQPSFLDGRRRSSPDWLKSFEEERGGGRVGSGSGNYSPGGDRPQPRLIASCHCGGRGGRPPLVPDVPESVVRAGLGKTSVWRCEHVVVCPTSFSYTSALKFCSALHVRNFHKSVSSGQTNPYDLFAYNCLSAACEIGLPFFGSPVRVPN